MGVKATKQSDRTGEVLRKLEPLDRLADTFACLGSGPRLRLLFLLHYRPELNVGELSQILGVPISGVSMNIRRLRDAGLVACRRDGPAVCCTLASESIHIRALRSLFCQIAEETGCCVPASGSGSRQPAGGASGRKKKEDRRGRS